MDTFVEICKLLDIIEVWYDKDIPSPPLLQPSQICHINLLGLQVGFSTSYHLIPAILEYVRENIKGYTVLLLADK